MIQFTCTKYLCRVLHEKKTDTKKTLRSHNYIKREKLRKYLSGILKNQFINDISNFNNKHIIQYNNKPIYNIPEEQRYISSMTPIGSRNGQDESRCYVNSSFQVLFFNIFFRTLIMNIDCEMF